MPSLQGLFYICEYFGITPEEFFDEGNVEPAELREMTENFRKLDPVLKKHLSDLIRHLADTRITR